MRSIILLAVTSIAFTGILAMPSDTPPKKKIDDLRSGPAVPDSGLLWQRIDGGKDKPDALVYFPTLVVGTSVIYNLPGARPPVCLKGETLAGIYSGRITRWNDREITATNPGAKLPPARIRLFYRDDENGMSWLLSRYLSQVSYTWATQIGMGVHPQWPRGIGVHGESRMIARIEATPYSIGFADFYFARAGHTSHAALQNKAGSCQQPSVESINIAANAAAADLQLQSELNAVDADAPNAYPIAGFSGLVIPSYKRPNQRAETVVDLLRYILTDGQKLASDSGYVALPPQLVEQELRALSMMSRPLPK